MYFIEKISKIFKKKDEPTPDFTQKDDVELAIEESKRCHHSFVPIDKTGKTYACIHCGLLIKGKPKNLNFFEGNK